MVLDIPVQKLIEKIGHDGSEILWPELPEPICRRGHHLEEIQMAAYDIGVILTSFTPAFEYTPNEERPVKYQFDLRSVFERYSGIMVGQWIRGGPHAVAWSAMERMIYDPDGHATTDLASFELDYFIART